MGRPSSARRVKYHFLKRVVLTGDCHSRNIFADIHLCPAFCHPFSGSEKIMGDFFINISLPAIRADLSRDVFYHNSDSLPVQSNGCRPLFCLPVPADYTFHGFLRVNVSVHIFGSGSYAVITIASRSTLLYAKTTWSGRSFAMSLILRNLSLKHVITNITIKHDIELISCFKIIYPFNCVF